KRVINKSSAEALCRLMVRVVENGSGKKAACGYGGTGGKTSSAQTGAYENGSEIVHGWFTGFYPAENPRYAITVLEEGGGNGGALPAQIFAEICRGTALHDDPLLGRSAK
ncbi:MAG: penicillin-binding transpeptidase domain-containing protein, partial [Angelakisella sp.]